MDSELQKIIEAAQSILRGERALRLQAEVNEPTALIAQAFNNLLEELEAYRGLANKVVEEDLYHTVFHETFRFMGVLSPEGILLEANETALAFGNLQRSDVVGRFFWEGFWWSDSNRTQTELQEAIRRAAEGEFIHYDVHLQGVGKPTHFFDLSIKPVQNNVGDIIFLLVEATDITERKQFEQELETSRNKAVEAYQAKSDFLVNLSNEIGHPLYRLSKAAATLHTTTLNEEQRTIIQSLSGATDELSRLINAVLDFSKIERGKVQLELLDFDLVKVVKETLDLFQTKVLEKGLLLHRSIDREVKDIGLVRGDPTRLRQILMNLLSNAVGSTEQGYIMLRLKLVSSNSDVATFRFEIHDTGKGISPDLQRQLFQSFSGTDNLSTGGTGLGLSIARRLVELMNGKIGLESTEGEGSIFWFELPFPCGQTLSQRFRLKQNQPNLLPPVKPVSSPYLILVAEDNVVNQRLIVTQLAKLGYRNVQVVDNGLEAVRVATQQNYSLIFMDCQMPELDGFAATKRIRQAEAVTGWRSSIIAITANAMEGDRQRCLAAGMDDYLSKPVSLSQLRRVLDYWLISTVEPSEAVSSEPNLNEEAPLFGTVEQTTNTNLYQLDNNVLEALRELLDSEKPGQFARFVTMFIEDMKKHLVRLDSAITNVQFNEIRQIAHTLKGSSLNMGARGFASVCFELEQLAVQQRLEGARELFLQLQQFYPTLEVALRTKTT